MTTKLNASFETIVAAVKANNGIVGDDHNNGTRTLKLDGLAAYEKGNKITLVGLINSRAFCLNEVYLTTEGKPRISKWATGAVIELRDGMNLHKGIESFNTAMATHEFTEGDHIPHYELF